MFGAPGYTVLVPNCGNEILAILDLIQIFIKMHPLKSGDSINIY